MRNPLRMFFAAVVAAASLIATPGLAVAHDGYDSLLAKVKRATSKYHNIDKAIADGYLPTDVCVAMPSGGMGYHYVKPSLMDDTIDAFHPEILVYVPGAYGRRLGALEYFKPDADQDLNTSEDRPMVFGVPFDGPMPGHEVDMPVHYDLHVWFFKRNPDGLFAAFNPRVTCP